MKRINKNTKKISNYKNKRKNIKCKTYRGGVGGISAIQAERRRRELKKLANNQKHMENKMEHNTSAIFGLLTYRRDNWEFSEQDKKDLKQLLKSKTEDEISYIINKLSSLITSKQSNNNVNEKTYIESVLDFIKEFLYLKKSNVKNNNNVHKQNLKILIYIQDNLLQPIKDKINANSVPTINSYFFTDRLMYNYICIALLHLHTNKTIDIQDASIHTPIIECIMSFFTSNNNDNRNKKLDIYTNNPTTLSEMLVKYITEHISEHISEHILFLQIKSFFDTNINDIIIFLSNQGFSKAIYKLQCNKHTQDDCDNRYYHTLKSITRAFQLLLSDPDNILSSLEISFKIEELLDNLFTFFQYDKKIDYENIPKIELLNSNSDVIDNKSYKSEGRITRFINGDSLTTLLILYCLSKKKKASNA